MSTPAWRRYEVGGAVRDALLGRAVSDRDWVVVGATPEQLVADGFLPVGRDFPVFLHPKTREEHALARTERKTAPGYHGFVFHASPEVTLEEDLARRDLTINAIARDENGRLVDPHGGQRDLAERVLRHVSGAFVEDPVRILRLARFAARFPDFRVAPETADLMQHMVAAGEVDALVAERVWQEFSRGLMEARPSRMLAVLRGCGALQRLLPPGLEDGPLQGPEAAEPPSGPPGEVDAAHLALALDAAEGLGARLEGRFALCATAWTAAGDAPPGAAQAPAAGRTDRRERRATELAEHWRVSAECRDRAGLTVREAASVIGALQADAAGVGALLDRWDAWRRPDRVIDLLAACRAAAQATAPAAAALMDQAAERMQRALQAARRVDTAQAAASAVQHGARGPAIGAAVLARRIEAIHTEFDR